MTIWRSLPSILEQILNEELVSGEKAALGDMLNLLLRKGLIRFNSIVHPGWSINLRNDTLMRQY